MKFSTSSRMKAALLTTLSGMLWAVAAEAALITTYTSRLEFETALTSPLTFDFNQPNGLVSSLGNELTVSTVGGDATGRVYNNSLCGSVGGSVNCFAPQLFTFDAPGRAFGFDEVDFTSGEEGVVNFSFLNGDADQSFTFDLGDAAALTPTFFGAISDVDISTVEYYSREIGSSEVGGRASAMDNVTVNDVASVPEPATLVLLGLGLAGIGLSRRQRRPA